MYIQAWMMSMGGFRETIARALFSAGALEQNLMFVSVGRIDTLYSLPIRGEDMQVLLQRTQPWRGSNSRARASLAR